MKQEALIPKVGVVTDIRQDTPDVKTFRVVGLDGNKLFEHMPGQCAMVSIPGIAKACSPLHLLRQTRNSWNFRSRSAAV